MNASKPPDGLERCGAVFKGKAPCKHPAGYGTNHQGIGRCKHHGGSTPTHEAAASKEIARRECASLGIPIETTPAEALIHAVWEAAGNVQFYRQLVQQLPTHPGADTSVADGRWEHGQPGLYGHTRHAGGEPTGEGKPHVLVVLYNDERKRLVDAAAAALRAGVEERRLRIAEADAERIAEAQVAALSAMGLADRLEEFREHFNTRLAAGEPAHLGAAAHPA